MKLKQKPKKNKTTNTSLKIWQFILLWVSAEIGAFLMAWWVIDSMGRFNPLDATNAILMGLGMGVPLSVVQYYVIRSVMHTRLRYWIPISAVGWLMSGIILFYSTVEFPVEISIQTLLFFLIPSILQFFILRRYVPNAWLWMLANAIGGIVLALPITTTRSLEVVVLTSGGLLQTIVTGVIIYWLFRQFQSPDVDQKAKI